eukprot:scaffold1807_cov140-Cylindrotheca_fusiformis.AAC.2
MSCKKKATISRAAAMPPSRSGGGSYSFQSAKMYNMFVYVEFSLKRVCDQPTVLFVLNEGIQCLMQVQPRSLPLSLGYFWRLVNSLPPGVCESSRKRHFAHHSLLNRRWSSWAGAYFENYETTADVYYGTPWQTDNRYNFVKPILEWSTDLKGIDTHQYTEVDRKGLNNVTYISQHNSNNSDAWSDTHCATNGWTIFCYTVRHTGGNEPDLCCSCSRLASTLQSGREEQSEKKQDVFTIAGDGMSARSCVDSSMQRNRSRANRPTWTDQEEKEMSAIFPKSTKPQTKWRKQIC